MAKLLDPYGKPVRRSDLTREVMAATIGSVRTPQTGYPGDGLDPVRLAQILRAADQGDPVEYMELAEVIEERDPHYLGVLGTRRRSVSQIPITVQPADDSAEAERHAETLRQWLKRDELQGELFDILDGIGKGYSFTEIIWDTSEGQWQPAQLKRRDQRWFRFDLGDLETPRRLNDQGQEIALEPFKFIYAHLKSKSGLPLRSGLARVAMWAYLFKKFTERDWAIFTQTYGQPLRVGKWGNGASEADKDTLFRAVANIAGDCAAIIPTSMEIDFVESGNVNATGQLYKERAEFYDLQVSKLVLGQTATTDAVTGGLGSGKEHREVQKDIEAADAMELQAILNRDLARPFVTLEHGPQKYYPRLIIGEEDEEDLVAFGRAVAPFIDRGLEVDEQEIRDRFKLKKPENGAKLLRPLRSAPGGSVIKDQGAIIKRAEGADGGSRGQPAPTPALQASEAEISPEPVSRQIAESGVAEILPSMSGMLGQISQMMDAASSFDELREMLIAAYPDLDTGQLQDTLQMTMTMASSAGMIEVAGEDV